MNKYDLVIGIDIGLSGGISFFDPEEKDHEEMGLIYLKEMPTIDTVSSSGKKKPILDVEGFRFIMETPAEHGDTNVLVVTENVHAFPGQGIVSTGTLMEQKGVIKGMCSILRYDLEFVTPTVWQKSFGIVAPKELKGKANQAKRKKWLKNESLLTARAKFPGWENKLGENAHGLSDAILIGLWAVDLFSYPSK